MTKSDFLQFCYYLQLQNKEAKSTGPLSCAIIEMIDPSCHAISILLKEILSDLGMEWFEWFFFELDFISGSLRNRALLSLGDQQIELKTTEDLYELLCKEGCFLNGLGKLRNP